MSSNNRISNLVDSQLPFFVRNDHRTFVRFIEAYYEYLEQSDKTLHTMKNIINYNDIDYTVGAFEEELYKQYLNLIPQNTAADKHLILKHVKDFYRARGTEKSIRFLLNILFGNAEDVSFYYPKDDILRASDGKWFIEKSLRTRSFRINGIANSDIATVQNFATKTITGNTSGAQANVERVDLYYEQGTLIYELKITGQTKEFSDGETLFTLFDENGVTKSITANLFSGVVTSTTLITGGSGYEIGDQVVVEGDGSGAEVIVQSVTSGNVTSIGVVKAGAGFRVNNVVTFTGGGGSGANAYISVVDTSGNTHPNSYNIIYSTISLEANTAIGNTTYGNLISALSDPANSAIANSMSSFVFGNTGPVVTVVLSSSGVGYSSLPTVDVQANTRVRSLGILGSMTIENGGVGYEANDKIHFTNVTGGYGVGALGNVAEVDANGTITRVEFIEVPGHLIGGGGYSQNRLPIASVVSANGDAAGANIQVTAILGDGESLTPVTGSIGVIQSLRIVTGGTGYTNATLNLTSIGDGTAQANATVVSGVFTYPGRWLNDDGHLSGYNFLEDRDYYQPFSYVVRTNKPFNDYRKPLKELVHPAGLNVFGEYLIEDNTSRLNTAFRGTSSNNSTIFKKGTYEANISSLTQYSTMKYKFYDRTFNNRKYVQTGEWFVDITTEVGTNTNIHVAYDDADGNTRYGAPGPNTQYWNTLYDDLSDGAGANTRYIRVVSNNDPDSYLILANLSFVKDDSIVGSNTIPSGTSWVTLDGDILVNHVISNNDNNDEFSVEVLQELGNVVINTTSHGYSGGEEVYLEFVSGDSINISNGLYTVTGIANANTLYVTSYTIRSNTSGNVYTGIAS